MARGCGRTRRRGAARAVARLLLISFACQLASAVTAVLRPPSARSVPPMDLSPSSEVAEDARGSRRAVAARGLPRGGVALERAPLCSVLEFGLRAERCAACYRRADEGGRCVRRGVACVAALGRNEARACLRWCPFAAPAACLADECALCASRRVGYCAAGAAARSATAARPARCTRGRRGTGASAGRSGALARRQRGWTRRRRRRRFSWAAPRGWRRRTRALRRAWRQSGHLGATPRRAYTRGAGRWR